jgi:membrane protein DedA with SNARE-associated domain
MIHAAQFALTHGATLLFTWILVQQAGVPIPSAPLLIAVGSLASNGRLRLVPSLVAAFTVCLLADGFPVPRGFGGTMSTALRQYDCSSRRGQQHSKEIQGYECVLIFSWLGALLSWGFLYWAVFRLLCNVVQFVQHVPRLLK